MKWLREAISDEDGRADIAYISIGALTASAITSLTFIFVMSAVSYHNCRTITQIAQKAGDVVTSIAPCTFDPLPVGQAAGLIFGAFGALIGALAGYMAATRRREKAGG